MIEILCIIVMTLLPMIVVPGVIFWAFCGAPSPRFAYAWMLVFGWPLLLLSESYYQEYLSNRNRALDKLMRERDKEEQEKEKRGGV